MSDSLDTVKQSFTVSVVNTNREPTFESMADKNIATGDEMSYQIKAIDVDGDTVAFNLIYALKGMKIIDGSR